MKIVIAMDSFKGSVSAGDACAAVRRGVLARLPDARLETLPMADGGDGTARVLLAARGGVWVDLRVSGPMPGTRVDAGFAWLPEGPWAIVEMATASGIALLDPERADPLRTTSYGTGELLAGALVRSPARVWLAIGGSATVDGGVGVAQALGWRFLDRAGREVGLGGEALERIDRIAEPHAGKPDLGVPVEVLCDVDNPLLGERGAARVFGPQKGATREQVARLEAGLAHFAGVVERDLGLSVADVPGAGAAGGLGAGAIAFLGARLVLGVDAVMDAVGLDRALRGADWIITGEGRFDSQSMHGKVVSGVARRAAALGVRTAVIAGAVRVDPEQARAGGVDEVEQVTPAGNPLEQSLRETEALIAAAAQRLAARLP